MVLWSVTEDLCLDLNLNCLDLSAQYLFHKKMLDSEGQWTVDFRYMVKGEGGSSNLLSPSLVAHTDSLDS